MTLEEFKQKYKEKTYLGDGLYANFDGFHIFLYAERENGIHFVALDPDVFDELVNYRDQIYQNARTIGNIK